MTQYVFIITVILLSCAKGFSKNKSYSTMKKSKIVRPEDLIGPARADEAFLSAVSQAESSGGTNLDHKTMKSGIHQDDRAAGEFGVMPNTVRELARRLKRRDHRLQLDPSFGGDPEIEQYADDKIPQDVLQYAMDNTPDMTDRVARYMERLSETRQKGDLDRMAYGWHEGHNKLPGEITQKMLDNNEYVQKHKRFRALQDTFKPKK